MATDAEKLDAIRTIFEGDQWEYEGMAWSAVAAIAEILDMEDVRLPDQFYRRRVDTPAVPE